MQIQWGVGRSPKDSPGQEGRTAPLAPLRQQPRPSRAPPPRAGACARRAAGRRCPRGRPRGTPSTPAPRLNRSRRGLIQIVGQAQPSSRDYPSKHWATSRNLHQLCETHLLRRPASAAWPRARCRPPQPYIYRVNPESGSALKLLYRLLGFSVKNSGSTCKFGVNPAAVNFTFPAPRGTTAGTKRTLASPCASRELLSSCSSAPKHGRGR
jgi:hypothetical protein